MDGPLTSGILQDDSSPPADNNPQMDLVWPLLGVRGGREGGGIGMWLEGRVMGGKRVCFVLAGACNSDVM